MKRAIAVLLGCALAASVAAGPKSDYMIHCMGCHMMDGSGMPPEVPSFDDRLAEIVAKDGGRAYLIRVPGASQSPLSDEALANVLTWVLKEYASAALPDDFRDFTGAEVAKFRPMILADPEKVRRKLLAR